jgi:WS/DGAT/MGAT family acyltransferase
VTLERLARKFEQDIQLLPEFRQRLKKLPIAFLPPVLVDDPLFRFGDHVEFLALKTSDPLRELSGVIGRFASEPLDKAKPLWKALFIEGLPDNQLALCTKSHHLISDGVQGAEFMSQLYDDAPVAGRHKFQAKASTPVFEPTLEVIRHSWSNYWNQRPNLMAMLRKTANSLQKRRDYLDKDSASRDLVPTAVGGASKRKFNGPITGNRLTAFGSLPMATLKAIKLQHETTINDIILAACTLSMRDYLIATHDSLADPLVCAVPVSLRRQDTPSDSGNMVGNMLVKLPVEENDPVKCLQAVKRHSKSSKAVFEYSFENLLMGYVGMLPPGIANTGLKALFGNRLAKILPPQFNLVISNISGPRIPLYMEGARLIATYPIGPVLTGCGLNITFMSQVDRMNFTVQTCRENLPEAWELAEGILSAVGKLEAGTLKPQSNAAATAVGRKKAAAGVKRKTIPKSR